MARNCRPPVVYGAPPPPVGPPPIALVAQRTISLGMLRAVVTVTAGTPPATGGAFVVGSGAVVGQDTVG